MSYNKETGLYEGYIYKITNKINGKIYIGQTRHTIESRFKTHINSNSPYSIVDNAIKKYGEENFFVEEVEKICSTSLQKLLDKLNEAEISYIDYFKSKVEYNNYNIHIGGKATIEYKEQPVDRYDLDGNNKKSYNSMVEACRDLGLLDEDYSNISACCNGRRRVAYGYIWRYKNHPFKEFHIYHQHIKNVPIDVYNLNGELIEQYDDIYEIENCLINTNRNQIYAVCNGNRTMYFGKVYRYKGDAFDKYSLPRVHRSNTPINCYTLDDKYIQTYETTTIAGKILNPNNPIAVRKNISAVCNGTKKSCYGFHWYYSDDPNQPDKSKIITKEEFRKQQLQVEQQTA